MAGYEARYDSLEDMILRDQYFLTCDKSLQTFLKEKGKLSLKEMTKASNDYYEAHGSPNGNQDKRYQMVTAINHIHTVNQIMVSHMAHQMFHFLVRTAV